jgi:hypothetical protein
MIRRLVEVPSTWEGWAMRVLTICTVLVLGAAIMIGRQVSGVMDFMEESRSDRTAFQQEQQQRTCVILEHFGLTQKQLEEVQCSSR